MYDCLGQTIYGCGVKVTGGIREAFRDYGWFGIPHITLIDLEAENGDVVMNFYRWFKCPTLLSIILLE